MSDLQFVAGVFRDFKATVKVHLGKLQQDLTMDKVVQFDGVTVKLDGVPHPYPELRSAIKAGWLTPVGTNVGDYVPQPANVPVRAALDKTRGKMASTEVQRDETFVADVKKTTTDGVKLESKAFNPVVVREAEGDGRTVGSAVKKPGVVASGPAPSSEGETVARLRTAAKRTITVDGSTSMNADEASDDVTSVVEHVRPQAAPKDNGDRQGQSSEAGKVIANVHFPSKRKVVVTDAGAVDAEISKLDNETRVAVSPKGTRDITALVGDALEDMIPVLEPENRGRILAEQNKARRLAQAAQAAPVKLNPLAQAMADAEAEDEGDDDDEPPPPAAVLAKPPKSVEDFVINGGDLELAPGVRWNKQLHWKQRVKLALQYRDRPEVLALIRGHEVPTVVKQIDLALEDAAHKQA